jgi:hypothetical protein
MRIEIRLITRKLIALKAEIDASAFEATHHSAIWVLAGAVPASEAIGLTEVLQQRLELRIILKDGQELREALSINVKRSQEFAQLHTPLSDLPCRVR